eukprot:SAG31_NODE_566_length_14037_cov_32.372148_5_plen_101_part_00
MAVRILLNLASTCLDLGRYFEVNKSTWKEGNFNLVPGYSQYQATRVLKYLRQAPELSILIEVLRILKIIHKYFEVDLLNLVSVAIGVQIGSRGGSPSWPL